MNFEREIKRVSVTTDGVYRHWLSCGHVRDINRRLDQPTMVCILCARQTQHKDRR